MVIGNLQKDKQRKIEGIKKRNKKNYCGAMRNRPQPGHRI